MKRPGAAELETTKILLSHEGGDGEHPASAAARVYKKLHDRLAPIIGSAGVRALFFRSLRTSRLAGYTFLEGGTADPEMEFGKQLHDSLHGRTPSEAAEATAVVFATFIGLLTTFIGDRLTRQVLRGVWPDIAEAAPVETKK
jgi:hypothetical protein